MENIFLSAKHVVRFAQGASEKFQTILPNGGETW